MAPTHPNVLGTSQADPNGIQSECGALGSPRKGADPGQSGNAGKLYRGHVIEGVVQLLANGLVLQFLGIELIWTGTGTTGKNEGTE